MHQSELNVTQVFWLILIAFIVALGARRLRVPYALALVVTGLAIGVSPWMKGAHLDPSTLFTVFLPPLLFEAAINLRLEALKADWKPITVYTLAGTLLAALIVAEILSVTLAMPFRSALVFGSLISATDPIAVISVFKQLGADKRLTLIVEAESLFNDGIAVVLFTVALALASGGQVSLAESGLQFCRLIVGGVMLGAAIGWLASRVHDGLDDRLVEITLTSIVAFGSYLSAETLHVSGVMAVVSAGLVIGNYGMPSAMTPGTRLAVAAFWEYAGFVVNSLVFLLIGIEAAGVRWGDKFLVVVVAGIAVLVGRSVVYPLTWIVNLWGGNVEAPWRHILFWGGLRGALSLALALGLSRDFPGRETWIAAAFGVVLFSLLGQGITLSPLLRHLQRAEKPTDPDGKGRLMSEGVACRAALLELESARLREAHPNWALELLVRQYQEKLTEIEKALDRIAPDYRNSDFLAALKVRESVLLAEKSAFQEAERRGWIEAGEWSRIARQIDAELVALENDVQSSP